MFSWLRCIFPFLTIGGKIDWAGGNVTNLTTGRLVGESSVFVLRRFLGCSFLFGIRWDLFSIDPDLVCGSAGVSLTSKTSNTLSQIEVFLCRGRVSNCGTCDPIFQVRNMHDVYNWSLTRDPILWMIDIFGRILPFDNKSFRYRNNHIRIWIFLGHSILRIGTVRSLLSASSLILSFASDRRYAPCVSRRFLSS